MISHRPSAAMAGPVRFRFRLILCLLTLAGLLSLVLFPVELLVGHPRPAPIWVMRLLVLIQPAILLVAALIAGFTFAPKLGLRAPATEAFARGEPVLPVLRRQLPFALLVAAIVALILLLFTRFILPEIFSAARPEASELLAASMPPMTRLLYGGIAEEVMTRWGLVSLFGWIGWRIAGKPQTVGRGLLSVAVGLAALLFAAGHVPLLYAMMEAPPSLLLFAVLGGNLIPGLLFGWLFVTRGLEAAIIAHMGAHAFAMLLGA